jgi:anti-anti-sigma factor
VGAARPFEVTTTLQADGRFVVRVRGEADLATAPELEEALSRAPAAAPVVVDLAECDFLDSSAIRVLLAGVRRTHEEGAEAALVASSPGIRRVLEIVGLEEHVPIHADAEAAGVDPDA